jgi:hypothetical protein
VKPNDVSASNLQSSQCLIFRLKQEQDTWQVILRKYDAALLREIDAIYPFLLRSIGELSVRRNNDMSS